MTPLDTGIAKIKAGSFDLTIEEMTAMAMASASKNPVMVPAERDLPDHFFVETNEAGQVSKVNTGPGGFNMVRTEPVQSSPWNAALIDQILDITEEFPRDKAKQALTLLFTDKNVRTSIEKTWDNEDAYKGITTGT